MYVFSFHKRSFAFFFFGHTSRSSWGLLITINNVLKYHRTVNLCSYENEELNYGFGVQIRSQCAGALVLCRSAP